MCGATTANAIDAKVNHPLMEHSTAALGRSLRRRGREPSQRFGLIDQDGQGAHIHAAGGEGQARVKFDDFGGGGAGVEAADQIGQRHPQMLGQPQHRVEGGQVDAALHLRDGVLGSVDEFRQALLAQPPCLAERLEPQPELCDSCAYNS